MCPAVAARSPESRLMSVVLPAPLGPSTACSMPRWSSIATLLVAIRPPNRFDNPRVESSASAMAAVPLAPDQRAAKTGRDAREPARQEDHEHDDRAAEQQLPMRG